MRQLLRGLTEKRTPEGICVLTAHYSADPDRAAQQWKETERLKYTSEEAWQREQEIVFSAGGGERLFADLLTLDRLADEYARRIFNELQHKPLDRELLDRFAARIVGRGEVCDMGCGPGQIARYLRDAGATFSHRRSDVV
jgi:2-polyprenyl-3-methyl-5-hydroxy-6-metoxy-1,4-benzoquinol methylase